MRPEGLRVFCSSVLCGIKMTVVNLLNLIVCVCLFKPISVDRLRGWLLSRS